jgi:hypothetical protein
VTGPRPSLLQVKYKVNILSRVGVWLIDGFLDRMIVYIAPYTFTQFRTTGQDSAIAIVYTSQFTVAHALGFSVFTSRILATGSSQSHCKFKSLNHLKLPSPELDPILILAAWYTRYIASGRNPQKTPSYIVKERAYSSVA